MGAERTRADREHDVVDRRPEAFLQGAHLGHLELGEGDRPPGADGRLERGGRAEGQRHRTEAVADHAAGQPDAGVADFADGAQHAHRALDEARQRVRHQLRLRGQARGDPRRARFGDGSALGREVQQLRQHLGAGHAVDDGMVHLRDQPDLPAGEPLNHVHLPWRLPGCEGTAHHLGDKCRELGLATGRRERGAVKVVVQLELRVVHPARVIETQRDGHEPTSEGGQCGDPRREQIGDAFEGVATFCGGRVEDAGVRDLHRGLRRVGVDEHRVDAGHSLHVRLHGGESCGGLDSATRRAARRTLPLVPGGPPCAAVESGPSVIRAPPTACARRGRRYNHLGESLCCVYLRVTGLRLGRGQTRRATGDVARDDGTVSPPEGGGVRGPR